MWSVLPLSIAAVHAQVVVPATPGKFMPRPVGDSVSGNVQVLPKDGAEGDKVRYTSHVVLSESRYWTSAEGKPLEAKLIAFEDMTVETAKGAAEPVAPVPPAHPTVIRDGKVRLLAGKTAYILSLDRLSRQDREFIQDIQAAIERKLKAGR
jgi:hypothetical protein